MRLEKWTNDGGTILNDGKQQEQLIRKKGDEKQAIDIKRTVIISLAVFITFCCCILFFFAIYRYNGFVDYWKNLAFILQPIIIGLVLAYLLNPVMKTVERWAAKLLTEKAKMKSTKKIASTSRVIGIVGSLLFLFGVIVILLAAIIPAVSTSIADLVKTLPEQVNALIDWVYEIAEGDSEFAHIAEEIINKTSVFFESWITDYLLPQAETYISSITSGVIASVKLVLNILVGLIVSVYVMASQEKFAGQAKKILYAVFKPVQANVIIKVARKSNSIFGGFISGKILDSAIIGVIAYIVLAIMKMPDTVLVAVIVGVTNVIPFFGPFIGAIPSFIIIVLQNPMQGIYFLIFIVILQQIDGNIIGPKILGDSTGLSSFWVIFAIMVFGGLWGFFGMLLGVPVMAVIYYIVQSVVSYLLKKRGIPDSEVDYVKLKSIDKYSPFAWRDV